MRRRGFLRRLAIAPVIAAVATDLVFGSPEMSLAATTTPVESKFRIGDLVFNRNAEVFYVTDKGSLRQLFNAPSGDEDRRTREEVIIDDFDDDDYLPLSRPFVK